MGKEKQYGGKYTILLVAIAAFLWMAFASSVRMDASAASSIEIGWVMDYGYDGSSMQSKITLQVEAGQTFFVGDFLDSYDTETSAYCSGMSGTKGLTFSVDKPSYLRLDRKTGYARTLKQGKAVVTAKYKGKRYVCTLNIKKKGALKSTTTYGKLNRLAADIVKLMEKPSAKNMMQMADKKTKFDKLWGPLIGKGKITYKGASSKGNKLLVPLALHINRTAENLLYEYCGKNDPLKTFKIKKAKAFCSTGKITLTLEKAVTKDQIAHLQYMAEKEMDSRNHGYTKPSSKKAYFTTRVECDIIKGGDDWSDSYCSGLYAAICQVEQGKKTVTVTLCNMNENENAEYARKKKLMKDAEYVIGNKEKFGDFEYAWGRATKVVAK